VQGILDEVGEGDFLTAKTLSGLQMPTLLVCGRSEKLLPYAGLDDFRAHLPATATIREVPGFGHISQMERPQQLVAMLIDFARAHLG
jgi:pimeloyl-ACP methyl ester carboxylesterase